jgi:hypothetical protein
VPVTLEELFSAAQLSSGGTVNWGEAIPEVGPGVYVVSLADGYWNEGESIIYMGEPRDWLGGSVSSTVIATAIRPPQRRRGHPTVERA